MSYRNGDYPAASWMVLCVIATLAILAGFGGRLSARNVSSGKREQTPVEHKDPLTKRAEIDNSQPQSANENAQAQTRVGTVKPGAPAKVGVSALPDLPLRALPRMPISTKFLIEHRTALEGQAVRVRGFIVAVPNNVVGQSPGGNVPVANARPQPRIFLADTHAKKRDQNYDLVIMLREGDEAGYRVGARAEIKGVVEASSNTVYLRKTY